MQTLHARLDPLGETGVAERQLPARRRQLRRAGDPGPHRRPVRQHDARDARHFLSHGIPPSPRPLDDPRRRTRLRAYPCPVFSPPDGKTSTLHPAGTGFFPHGGLPTLQRPDGARSMYFTDRGIEELEKRRGEEEVTFEWLAEQLRTFVDLNPDFEVPVERLATWLARLDDEDEDE
ncbi:hypothetical protein TPA0906_23830 [Streptomyces olivaceus]|nr:hypothetical protein TPA0906_23830 [Streptomyces olivaceus]